MMPTITPEMVREAATRIAPYIRRTPLLPFDFLCNAERRTYVKCEPFQRGGSFKIRGASNCILNHLDQAKKSGVVAASAGNHAQGVGAICQMLGIRATIVMPKTTPVIKVHNTKSYGAEVQLVGSVYDEAYEHAEKLSQEKGLLLVPPFRDPHVIAGQGTAALELLDSPEFADCEAVIISVGGGGLAAGCAAVLRAARPDLKIYGVGAENAPSRWRSFHEKRVVNEPVKATLAEGVAVKKSDPDMLDLLIKSLDDFFLVEEESIAHAISVLAEKAKMVVEGAGALPVSLLLDRRITEKRVTALISGGNIDLPTMSAVLHRGLLEQGRLARLVVVIPDRPGGLNSITQIFCEQEANILEVHHQRSTFHAGIGETEVEVDLETKGREHTESVVAALEAKGYKVDRAS